MRIVWVIASRRSEEKIAYCSYFETFKEAQEEADYLNDILIRHNSRPVWQVYEAGLEIVRTEGK